MRVLVVTHYFAHHRSGVEIIAGEIAKRLARRGVRITWVASGPLEKRPEEGVRLLPMRACNVSEKWLGVPYPFWGPVSLAKLVREVARTDIVHLHDSLYMGNLFAFTAARLLRKPILVTQHIGLVPYSSRFLRGLMAVSNRTLGRMVLAGASRCVFYSEEVERYFDLLVPFRREPLFVQNGVDFDLFHPVPQEEAMRLRAIMGWAVEKRVVLFVGRFVEKKGLQFIRRLAKRLPEYQFILVGWGVERPETWGLENVQCLGSLQHEDIARCYQAADLLILPSVGEGFPLVIQEAMACGTPVLMSQDTAWSFEAVRSAAFVSELEDDALASSLRKVLESRNLLENYAKKAYAFAKEQWDWERSVERYLQILAVLSRRSQDPTQGA